MSEHHFVISADSHCGADLWDYRNYLESKYHPEFDDWARSIEAAQARTAERFKDCLLYTSPSPRDRSLSRMPSSA